MESLRRPRAQCFHGRMADFIWPDSWTEISEAFEGNGSRYATLPYLDDAVLTTFGFTSDDVVVVDASLAAVVSGRTSLSAIAHLLALDVAVFSRPGLQATVMASLDVGMVVSAAHGPIFAPPPHSAGHTAVPCLLTADPAMVQHLLMLVTCESHAGVALNSAMFGVLKEQVAAASTSPRELPALSLGKSDAFPPDLVAGVSFDVLDYYEGTASVDAATEGAIHRGLEQCHLDGFDQPWLLLEPDDPGLTVNEVLVTFGALPGKVYCCFPPALVVSDPIRIDDGTGRRFQILRVDSRYTDLTMEFWEFPDRCRYSFFDALEAGVVAHMTPRSVPEMVDELFSAWSGDRDQSSARTSSSFDELVLTGRPMGTRSIFPSAPVLP